MRLEKLDSPENIRSELAGNAKGFILPFGAKFSVKS